MEGLREEGGIEGVKSLVDGKRPAGRDLNGHPRFTDCTATRETGASAAWH
jgi:hypothetical protein